MPVPNRREAGRREQARRDNEEASKPRRPFSQTSKDFPEKTRPDSVKESGLVFFGYHTNLQVLRHHHITAQTPKKIRVSTTKNRMQ